MALSVLLADDHLIVRHGLKALLEREGMAVVAEASDGQEAVRLALQHRPEVAVLDLTMPILNGLDAAQEMQRCCPGTRPVLLTVHCEDPYVLRALQAGVKGYVLKSQAPADLVRAIHEVHRGAAYLSPGISGAVLEAYRARAAPPAAAITGRERQVLQLVAEGRSTKEVASILAISVKTAESHRTHLMKKLGVHETASLVRYAIRSGLVEP